MKKIDANDINKNVQRPYADWWYERNAELKANNQTNTHQSVKKILKKIEHETGMSKRQIFKLIKKEEKKQSYELFALHYGLELSPKDIKKIRKIKAKNAKKNIPDFYEQHADKVFEAATEQDIKSFLVRLCEDPKFYKEQMQKEVIIFKNKFKIENPKVNFEKWAEENGIDLAVDSNDLVIDLRMKYDEYNKQKAFKNYKSRQKWFKRPLYQTICCIALTFIICISAISSQIPKWLDRNNEPNYFTAQDTREINFEIDKIYNSQRPHDIFLFDQAQNIAPLFGFDTFGYVDIPVNDAKEKEDYSNIFSYIINEMIILATDGLHAFYVNYRVVVIDKEYRFENYVSYNNWLISDNIEIEETTIDFTIREIADDFTAFVKFTFDNYHYYLEVKGFPNGVAIEKSTLRILLENLIV